MSKMERQKARMGYLVILPVLLIFGLLIFYPTAQAIMKSLTNESAYNFDPEFVGLYNYVEILSDSNFWNAIKHSFVLVFFAVGLQYVLGLILALLLNEELTGMRWVKFIVMIPWVIPVAATVIMFDWMVIPKYGLLNMILSAVGLEEWTRYWFGDEFFAFPMIILMHVWRNVPFYAITLYAGLKAIPKTLYEAAEIDGANAWHRFRAITLPNLKYPSMIVIVLHVLYTFNNFDFVYLSTGGGPVGRTEVMATYVYQTAWNYYEYGKASAIGVVMMAILMVFSIVYIKLVRSEA